MSRRILVTRPSGQADDLGDHLRERGMTPISVPTVAIDASSATDDIDHMLTTLDGADWLVITSSNGADALRDRLRATRRILPTGMRVAAVGPATAEALTHAGVRVNHVPDAYLTVAIAEGLGDVEGRRVVLARADAATPELHNALTERGAVVEEVVAYRTVEGPASSRDPLREALHGELAGIAFTSSSTVRGLLRLASPIDRGRARVVPAFCIGPVTAATARQLGFDITAVAAEHTAAGLAHAISTHFAREDR
jgi:uroporphyrinogen III methyltransferase/synthase